MASLPTRMLGKNGPRIDESIRIDPGLAPGPRPDPSENTGATGWLAALNTFLERAFLKADVDTGC